MKIFSASQIRLIDEYTIQNEPISSISLMERAAEELCKKIVLLFPVSPFIVLAGPGNNGGDALLAALKLLKLGRKVEVWHYCEKSLSADCALAQSKLAAYGSENLHIVNVDFEYPVIDKYEVIIDGLFGSGLSRPLQGTMSSLVDWLNLQTNTIVSIDIPSGLSADTVCLGRAVRASVTLTLQFPKLSFFLPENGEFVEKWEVLDIGLHPVVMEQTKSDFHMLLKNEVSAILKKRKKFSHKGCFGHVLLIAGKKGMSGASVLAAKAVLHSGAGLVTVAGPECNRTIVQTAFPESIFTVAGTENVSQLPNIESYSVVAVGPGLGTELSTALFFDELLYHAESPLVLDADALNILALNTALLDLVPPNSVLTPHPGEFDRLFGNSANSVERLSKARKMAVEKQLFIVLKGAHTAIACPDGQIYFNSTGNSGLATAGTGDVLTGMIAGLMAQNYSTEDALKLAVYLHGLAADLAMEEQTEETFIASTILEFLPKAYKFIK